jgi:nicotinate-nucleotide pyrophosphorylase (carboxylating)
MRDLVLFDALIDRVLTEDLSGGDLTTEACVSEEARAEASAVARGPLVACGIPLFTRVFERLDPQVDVEILAAEGAGVVRGDVLARVRGRARALLMAERTALNLLQRASGVATQARRYVAALPAGSRVRIADTRKTTPGLRLLERYAVRTGGAHNHRNDLGSAVLIKDNHIVAAGGIAEAIARARARAPHTSRIEVEVQSLAELELALASRADIVLLDNFSHDDLVRAVARARRETPSPLLEVSGGVTLERIAAIAETGIDVISVGALTHSASAVDIALDLALVP